MRGGDRQRGLKHRIERACIRYGKSLESAKLNVKGSRKITYVLEWGRIDHIECIHEERSTSLIIPNHFKVVFEACNNVWIAEIEYSEDKVASAMYQVYGVDKDGGQMVVGSSGWLPNISGAIKKALTNLNSNDPAAQNRPNGRLYLGIFYNDAQDILKSVFATEPHRIQEEIREIIMGIISPQPQKPSSPQRDEQLAKTGRQFLRGLSRGNSSEVLDEFATLLTPLNFPGERLSSFQGLESPSDFDLNYGNENYEAYFDDEPYREVVPTMKQEESASGNKRVLRHGGQRLFESRSPTDQNASSKVESLEEKLSKLLLEIENEHNHKDMANDVTLTSEEYHRETNRVVKVMDTMRIAYLEGRQDLAKRTRRPSGIEKEYFDNSDWIKKMLTDDFLNIFEQGMTEQIWVENVTEKLFRDRNVDEKDMEELLGMVFHAMRNPEDLMELARNPKQLLENDRNGEDEPKDIHTYMLTRESDLRNVFNDYDLDGDGYLTVSDLRKICDESDISSYKYQGFMEWLDSIQADSGEKISFLVFYRAMVLLPPSQALPFRSKSVNEIHSRISRRI